MESASYNNLIYKLGSLHRLLRELASEDRFQGEHTISFTNADGVAQTVHVYIDGTDLQMTATEGARGIQIGPGTFED